VHRAPLFCIKGLFMPRNTNSHIQTVWNDIQSRLQDYPDWLVELGMSLLFGLVIGFVCRNFGRMLLFFCMSALITVFVLEYTNFIAIQAPGLRALFKDPNETVATWVHAVFTYARDRIVATAGLIIGFLFGWRLGR